MRWKNLLLLVLCVYLISDSECARDRKRNRHRNKNDDRNEENDEELGMDTRTDDEKRKETKDRAMALVERGEKDEKKEEESSSEEDDEKEKENNATEIVIPKRLRRTNVLAKAKELNDGNQQALQDKSTQKHLAHRYRRTGELKKSKELNDGQIQPLENKPSKSSRRFRRTKELKKAKELNDGEMKPLDKKPSQTHRLRRNHNKPVSHGKRYRKVRATKEEKRRIAEKQRYFMTQRNLRSTDEKKMEKTKDDLTDEERKFMYEHKYIKTHGLRPPVSKNTEPRTETSEADSKRAEREVEALPDPQREKEVSDESRDITLVSADAAEIREN